MMASDCIVLVFNADTKELLMVIDPDHNGQVDDPAWMVGPEKRKKVIVPRSAHACFGPDKMSPASVAFIQMHSEQFFDGVF